MGQWQRLGTRITHIRRLIGTQEVVTLSGHADGNGSPKTKRGGVTAEVVHNAQCGMMKADFLNMVPSVKGKIVLVSMPQPTGRLIIIGKEYGNRSFHLTKLAERRGSI